MVLGIGEYPPEYNPRVHGPYNPGRYYGPADKPIGEVKLGEFGSWLSRRNFSPMSMARAVGRGYWRWSTKWIHVRKGSAAAVVQFGMAFCIFNYIFSYKAIKYHKSYKHH